MRIPVSTYRFQVNADNPLGKLRALIPYLCELGTSDLYISPIYEARSGSTHGYDVTRPSRINPAVGTLDDLRDVAEAARKAGMGVLLDIVPNHMAASETNPWWRDVLENGRASAYASFFDVDWDADPPGTGRVLLPVLGQPLDAAIAAGEVRAGVDEGLPVLRYFDRSFPIDPATYPLILDMLDIRDESLHRLLSDVPHRDDVRRRADRRRSAERARQELRHRLLQTHGTGQQVVLSPEDVKRLHDAQPYSLWYWVRGTRRINYRRFFDISDLAGLRVEDETVFDAVHALTLPLIADTTLAGLRIDHIDGLRNPAAYLTRLRQRTGHAYLLVEKILIGDERLPADWEAEGTTGYDFTGALNCAFVDENGFDRLRTWYEAAVESPSFEEMVVQKKRFVIDLLFDGEARDLAAAFVELAARMGITLQAADALSAITELTATLSVYRTYITERGVPDASREQLLAAKSAVRTPPEPLDLLARMILLEIPAEHLPATIDFVMRWQQFTGPVMAKGLEDTTFYNYHALISLCEVGTWPPSLGRGHDLHGFLGARRETWPHAMNASSTHDTKRSEDVRARINVLSELPDEWIGFVEGCAEHYARFRTDVDGMLVPGLNEQVLLYQTLVGAWPLDGADSESFAGRIRDFMLKAMREAKTYTSWSRINQAYEGAVLGFCDAVLTDFEARSRTLRERVSFLGALNSLSQLLLKIGAPGVPDFYQGTETWDFSLVDPDNRRPVDYEACTRLAADARPLASMLQTWQDGAIKFAMTRTGLALRNSRPEFFASATYEPVPVHGRLDRHIIAFTRRLHDEIVVVAAPRWFGSLCRDLEPPVGSVWDDTWLELPTVGRWRNVLTDDRLSASSSLAAPGSLSAPGSSSAFLSAPGSLPAPGSPLTSGRLPTAGPLSSPLPAGELFARLPYALLVPDR